ncbi:MAG TPA: peptide chain release factor N(5)-glutamine methyltransferase [Polyangiaceae bacterium]|nr:peptide chain release factor N(5)-glutamine methyltransferase [Polyangiaceae bacterium]
MPEPPSPEQQPLSSPEPWSIARVLRFATEDFEKRRFSSPRLDAELLLGHVLGVDRVRLILDATRPLTEPELQAYRELIKRRRRGEPVAYLRGQREFYGRVFRVDRRVLVPRPETELLVEVALTRTRARSLYGRALDLCTGSGCVATTFARERRTWRVTGADISEPALQVARDNALRLGAIHNLDFVQGDLFEGVPPKARFELVTANAPYIPHQDIAGLDSDVRDFEPKLALDGGADGLVIIRRIVAQASARLVPGGVLALEVGYDQAPRVSELLHAAGFDAVQIQKDYAGHQRIVSAKSSSTGNSTP